MRHLVAFVLAGWFIFGGLFAVHAVGKQRKPLTPGGAVMVLIINSAVVAAILYVAGVL